MVKKQFVPVVSGTLFQLLINFGQTHNLHYHLNNETPIKGKQIEQGTALG